MMTLFATNSNILRGELHYQSARAAACEHTLCIVENCIKHMSCCMTVSDKVIPDPRRLQMNCRVIDLNLKHVDLRKFRGARNMCS